MSRLLVSLIVSVMLVGTTARADTFGGWQYTPPPGYRSDVSADHVALTKLAGSTFCLIAVFDARALKRPAFAEGVLDWHNIVAHTFKATVKRRASMQTKLGVKVSATTAVLVDDEGNEYAGVHYAVMPPGMIGSVLLISNTATSLNVCEPVSTAFVSSLAIDWTSPRFTDPEARVETPEGRWATVGATSREYTFSANGTFRFHSEASSGGRDRLRDETGRYTVLGNQLTLTALEVRDALVDGGVARPAIRAPLEKTTYTWGRRYLVETNEWQLVLTPRKATTRDGKLPTNAADYRYSDRARPAWKFAPGPGV